MQKRVVKLDVSLIIIFELFGTKLAYYKGWNCNPEIPQKNEKSGKTFEVNQDEGFILSFERG
jgi:hypothetical protein